MITFPDSTLVGKTVHEITVFRMVLKNSEVPSDVLMLIDKRKEKQPKKRFEIHQRLVKMKAKLNQ